MVRRVTQGGPHYHGERQLLKLDLNREGLLKNFIRLFPFPMAFGPNELGCEPQSTRASRETNNQNKVEPNEKSFTGNERGIPYASVW